MTKWHISFYLRFRIFSSPMKRRTFIKKLVLIEYIFYICVDEFQEFPYPSCKDDKRNRHSIITLN